MNTAAERNAINPAVSVKVLDQFGNFVNTDTSFVTLQMGTNPGGGSLLGTTTVQAVAGIATFTNVSINTAGVGYTLSAVDGGLALNATSAAFNIAAAAAHYVKFIQQPSSAAAGAALSPSVTVGVFDQYNNLVTTDNSSVTLSIGANPGSDTLHGTATVAAINGVANFSNVSVDMVGLGYTLNAADGLLIGDTSGTFNITPASANKLAFVAQPTNARRPASAIDPGGHRPGARRPVRQPWSPAIRPA